MLTSVFGKLLKAKARTSKSSKTTPVAFGFVSFTFHALLTGGGGGAGKSLIFESLSASSAQELVFCIFLTTLIWQLQSKQEVTDFRLLSVYQLQFREGLQIKINNQTNDAASYVSLATNVPLLCASS
jgi:hypothetical protein